MMKKLLLLSSALFTFHFGAKAQSASTPTTTTDTLNYFMNKEKFKLGYDITSPSYTTAPYFKAPTGAAVNSDAYVTHMGSIFRNKDTALIVNGLQAYASRQQNSLHTTFDVAIYLCKLNPATGFPVLPPMDSVIVQVNNNCAGNYCAPLLLTGALKNGPKVVKGDFAVLVRNNSTRFGDTVRFFKTHSLTPNSTVLTGPGDFFYKTGENLGVIRQNKTWYQTTHYTGAPGFGFDTDYEFLVAPIVQFDLQISQLEPANANTACVYECLTYTNTSSPELTNKQFNLNEFYRQLKPFQVQPDPGFFPDSILQWDFDDDHRIDTVPHLWGRVQNTFLAIGQSTICKGFDTAGVFPHGYMLGHYRKMTTCYSNRLSGKATFSTNIDYCGITIVDGIKQYSSLSNVSVYPNPAVNGKVTVSGLQGKNTVVVYDMLGQIVSAEVSEKDNVLVDLLKQPAGTYMIRISNADNKTRSVKVINQKN